MDSNHPLFRTSGAGYDRDWGNQGTNIFLVKHTGRGEGYGEAKRPDRTRSGRGKPLPSAESRRGERSAGGGNIGRGRGEVSLRTAGVRGRGAAAGGERRGENARGVRKAPVKAGECKVLEGMQRNLMMENLHRDFVRN